MTTREIFFIGYIALSITCAVVSFFVDWIFLGWIGFTTILGVILFLIGDYQKTKRLEELERWKEEAQETKPIILDDNEISISKYAEEFPENFKRIEEAEHD